MLVIKDREYQFFPLFNSALVSFDLAVGPVFLAQPIVALCRSYPPVRVLELSHQQSRVCSEARSANVITLAQTAQLFAGDANEATVTVGNAIPKTSSKC